MIQDQLFNLFLNTIRERETQVLEALGTRTLDSRYEFGQLQGKLLGLREARMVILDLLESQDK